MQLVSVNVGLPQPLTWLEQTVITAIVKQPVDGPVHLGRLNLQGDEQADLRVHGGETKAVYGYPLGHYAFWEKELELDELPPGSFGENLTVKGLAESETQIGDRFRVGDAIVMATEPRKPCNKLAMRFQRTDMIERFLFSMRSGIYFSVIEEGKVQAGDEVTCIHRESHGITVKDIIRLDVIDREDEEGLRRAAALEALPAKWRARFQKRLVSLERAAK